MRHEELIPTAGHGRRRGSGNGAMREGTTHMGDRFLFETFGSAKPRGPLSPTGPPHSLGVVNALLVRDFDDVSNS